MMSRRELAGASKGSGTHKCPFPPGNMMEAGRRAQLQGRESRKEQGLRATRQGKRETWA